MTHPHGVLSSITSEKTVLRTMLIGFSRLVALAVTTLLMFSSTASINAQEVAGAPTNPDAEQAEIADTSDEIPDQDESGIVAGGIGGRWLFRPKDSLWVGVDIATGPEDTYAYIQVGHAW